MYKIALPSREGKVDGHFGHCEYYTVFTISDENKVVEKETLESPQGCGCKSNIATVLQEKGVTKMIVGNIGNGAINVLNNAGIDVIRGCNGPVEEIIESWLKGEISDQDIVCDHADCGTKH